MVCCRPIRQARVFIGLVGQRRVDESDAAARQHGPSTCSSLMPDARSLCTMREQHELRIRPRPTGVTALAVLRGLLQRALPDAGRACRSARRPCPSGVRSLRPDRGSREAPGLFRPAGHEGSPCAHSWPPWGTSQSCQSAHARVVGQIDLQWRDGDVSMSHCMKSVPSPPPTGVACRADPVDRLAARVGLADHSFARMTPPEPAQAHGLPGIVGFVGMFTFSRKGEVPGGFASTRWITSRATRDAKSGAPSLFRPAKTRSPECRRDSLPSPQPPCRSRWCPPPCWPRC